MCCPPQIISTIGKSKSAGVQYSPIHSTSTIRMHSALLLEGTCKMTMAVQEQPADSPVSQQNHSDCYLARGVPTNSKTMNPFPRNSSSTSRASSPRNSTAISSTISTQTSHCPHPALPALCNSSLSALSTMDNLSCPSLVTQATTALPNNSAPSPPASQEGSPISSCHAPDPFQHGCPILSIFWMGYFSQLSQSACSSFAT